MTPSRKPPKRVLRQVLRLDRKYLDGNDLTAKELDKGYLFWEEDRERVIAYLLLEPHGEIFSIRSICVIPEYKGCGFGKRLLKSCLRWVRRHDSRAIYTYANAINYPSINMLVGLGFKIIRHYYRNREWWLRFRRES